jgi:murein DD-endopeptidase MepM/ murein hydrolase activator NlpD
MHTILKKVMPHNGTDFGAPTGTPIFAPSGGKIVRLGDFGANGNFIAIEHRGGYETGYSHLSRFEPGLKAGDTVKRLQPIGYVGSTGRSTGPHLHFSAKKDGKFIDPESLGLDRLTTLPKEELALFQKVKAKYDELLDAVLLPAPIVVATTAGTGTAEEGDSHFDEFGDDSALSGTVPNGPVESEGPALPVSKALKQAPPLLVDAPRPTAPAPRTGSALYMTDQELMRSQSARGDGEVEE